MFPSPRGRGRRAGRGGAERRGRNVPGREPRTDEGGAAGGGGGIPKVGASGGPTTRRSRT